MKTRYWNGAALVDANGPQLQAHCLDPQGIFVCFKAHNHEDGTCEYHCWKWNSTKPVPSVGEILARIQSEIPH